MDIHSNTNRSINKKTQDVIVQIYLKLIFDELGGLINKSTLDVIGFMYTPYG